MLATVEQLPRSREEALWAAEVAGLFVAAPDLRPGARSAVVAVLHSLDDDPSRPPAERADVLELLAALESAPARV